MRMKKFKPTRSNIALITIAVLLIAGAITAVALWQHQQHIIAERERILTSMAMTFQEESVIEYGSETSAEDLIVHMKGGVIEEYPQLDTKKIGKQTLRFLMKQDEVEKTFEYTVEVKDSEPPIILIKEDIIELRVNDSFDPSSNITSVSDPVDGDLQRQEEGEEPEKGHYLIVSDVDTSKAGTYTVRILAADANGNSAQQEYTVEVKGIIESLIPDEIKDLGDQLDTTKPTYVNGILLVNKNHPLPRSYGNGVDATAYAALLQLQAGAQEAGYSIPLISGYRSYDYQAQLYNGYVARDGKEAADRYSAQPGKSEHQSGLAFDVGSIDNNYGESDAGRWLAAHCADYGFILRYPPGKEHITGYMYEPWHIRYVGVSTARAIMSSGLTLEEYLGVN